MYLLVLSFMAYLYCCQKGFKAELTNAFLSWKISFGLEMQFLEVKKCILFREKYFSIGNPLNNFKD